jgi:hypothetical protein
MFSPHMYRERNAKLVPELLRRLKDLQQRGEEERDRIRSALLLRLGQDLGRINLGSRLS